MDLSICIVSWNVSEDLRSCLDSLYALDCAVSFETLVVDNASGDDTLQMLSARFPQVHVIANDRNLGFAAANNQALRAATGRYVMLLNPDTVVHQGALNSVVRFLDGHPDVGIAGFKLLYPDGSLQFSCRSFPNPLAASGPANRRQTIPGEDTGAGPQAYGTLPKRRPKTPPPGSCRSCP